MSTYNWNGPLFLQKQHPSKQPTKSLPNSFISVERGRWKIPRIADSIVTTYRADCNFVKTGKGPEFTAFVFCIISKLAEEYTAAENSLKQRCLYYATFPGGNEEMVMKFCNSRGGFFSPPSTGKWWNEIHVKARNWISLGSKIAMPLVWFTIRLFWLTRDRLRAAIKTSLSVFTSVHIYCALVLRCLSRGRFSCGIFVGNWNEFGNVCFQNFPREKSGKIILHLANLVSFWAVENALMRDCLLVCQIILIRDRRARIGADSTAPWDLATPFTFRASSFSQ